MTEFTMCHKYETEGEMIKNDDYWTSLNSVYYYINCLIYFYVNSHKLYLSFITSVPVEGLQLRNRWCDKRLFL